MKTKNVFFRTTLLIVSLFTQVLCLFGQGTLTFDEPWIYSGGASYRDYYEKGLHLQVVTSNTNSQSIGAMKRIGSLITISTPHNGTPHMEFENQYFGNYVIINSTTGDTFGFLSADLADPFAPSANIPIVFVGYKEDGSIVTFTYNTLAGLASFQNVQFGTDFSYGLTRVEIPSTAWAMDNLTFTLVPEPATLAVFGLGLGGLWLGRRLRSRPGDTAHR